MNQMGVTGETGDIAMEDLVACAVEAERLGYNAFLPTETSGKEAFSLLALAAHATRQIQVGNAIISVYTRTPTLIAMGIASLERFSNGRAFVGLGTGGPGFLARGHGVPMERPLARVREYVTILRGLLSGQRFSHQGQFFTVQDFRVREKIGQRKIPIYISALNPKMIALGGECADGVFLNMMPPRFAGEARAHIAEGARRAGRDPSTVTLSSLLPTCVEPGDADALTALRETVAFYTTAAHYHYMLDRAGLGDLAREVTAAWQARQHDRAMGLLTEDFLAQVTLGGGPVPLREQVRGYLDRGVYPLIYPVPRRGRGAEDMVRALRLVAEAAR